MNFIGKRAKVNPKLLKTLILCGFPLCRNYTVWANKTPDKWLWNAVCRVFCFNQNSICCLFDYISIFCGLIFRRQLRAHAGQRETSECGRYLVGQQKAYEYEAFGGGCCGRFYCRLLSSFHRLQTNLCIILVTTHSLPNALRMTH